MERRFAVTTPESVGFSYELAGVGSRFLAVMVDLAIQTVAFVALALLVGWLASSFGAPLFSRLGLAAKEIRAVGTALFIFATFVLFFGYFIVFEWRWNGQTPGKRLLGIRVVRDGGFPLDFASSVVRNLVRTLEFAAGFYAVSAVSTLLSPQNRRLGDYAAGTIVVRDDPIERAPFAQADREADAGVRMLTPELRAIVAAYAGRAPGLAAEPRRRLAASIAARVRPLLAANFAHLDDEALLAHLGEFV